jgi:predicted DNA-binding transcriptional regulator AlpA
MPDEELLTVEEGIARLGVSPATFWNLVKRYQVPKYKLPLSGKRIYFKPEDLDALRRPVRVDGAPEGKTKAA